MIDMNETKLTTLEQVRMFLAGTAEIGFCVTGEGEDGRYRHIAGVLTRFGYKRLKKPDKGLILRYLERWSAPTKQHIPDRVGNWLPLPAAFAQGLPALHTQHTCTA